jgi:hypothetical protein
MLPPSNNTLNVSRASLGAPDGLYLRKAGFRGSPRYRNPNNTLNVSRAALGAPVGLDLCETGFRGSPCRRDTTTHSTFRVPDRAPPMARIFVKPGSGARRAAAIQQHAQCFACRIGRQSLTLCRRTPALADVSPLRTNRKAPKGLPPIPSLSRSKPKRAPAHAYTSWSITTHENQYE